MADVEFLGLDDVLEIHRDQIERYGGSSGIRDMGLLQSAIAMPAAGVGGQYLHADVFEMAAAYLFHITRNHPFIDGNKRTGAKCCTHPDDLPHNRYSEPPLSADRDFT